jgi:hypothetical protein
MMIARTVRPAVGNGIGHAHEQRAVDWLRALKIKNAANSAHD